MTGRAESTLGRGEVTFSNEDVVGVVGGDREDADASAGQRFGDACQNACLAKVELTIDTKTCPAAFGVDLVGNCDVGNNH